MRDFKVSNLSKVLFPDSGITKGDLIEYYRRIGPYMLPHLRDRPITMQRFPDGIQEEGFFQKEISDYFPGWIERISVSKEGGSVTHLLCNDLETLAYVASQGCITLHIWLSRKEHLGRPDRMVFDLDPPGPQAAGVRQATRWVRDALLRRGLESVVQTTGSKGFHVVVPMIPEHSYERMRRLAREIAGQIAQSRPDELTVEHLKADRGNRIYIDWRRNGYAQTVVAPYSVRARPGAPVATPVGWGELSRSLRPDRYRIGNIFRRLGQKRSDPWENLEAQEQEL